VTGLVDGSSGDVIERYSYLPYGQFTVLDDDFSTDSDGQSDVDWGHLYQGVTFDETSGLFQVRNRHVYASLGTWNQRDAISYGDGMNVYQFEHSSPTGLLDPSGTKVEIIEGSPDEKTLPVGQLIMKSYSAKVDEALKFLESVNAERFSAIVKAKRATFGGKPFDGSKDDYKKLLEREKRVAY
jgi:RHS repeat-associated protein